MHFCRFWNIFHARKISLALFIRLEFNICSVSQDTCFQNPSESSDWFQLVHSVEYDQIFPLKSKNVGQTLLLGCPLVFSFKCWYIKLNEAT